MHALRHEDPVTDRDGRFADLGAGVRAEAVAALARIDTPAAREGVLSALDDPEDKVRRGAIEAIASTRDPAAAEPLAGAVAGWTEPEQQEARSEALEALIALNDADSSRRLAGLLIDREAEIEPADAEMVRRLADASDDRALAATIMDLIRGLRVRLDPDRPRALLAALAPESVPPLIDALEDEPARREAALALGAAHDSRAVEPLCDLLAESQDPKIRRAAAWALGEIRDPAAVETLLVATGDSDYSVRVAAGAGFDAFGNVAIAVALSPASQPALPSGENEDPLAPAVPGPQLGAAAPTPETDPEPPAVVHPPAPTPPRPPERPVTFRAALRNYLNG